MQLPSVDEVLSSLLAAGAKPAFVGAALSRDRPGVVQTRGGPATAALASSPEPLLPAASSLIGCGWPPAREHLVQKQADITGLAGQ